MDPENKREYVKERLDSLHNTDKAIVSFLDSFSKVLDNLHDDKLNLNENNEEIFKSNVSECYNHLAFTAINLRKEIKLLELSNSELLPSNINKKASNLNNAKLKNELKELNDI